MSGNCGHGWGYHSQGAAGPCDKCEKEKKLLAERDALRADAERYRWLRPRLYSIDFDYSEAHAAVLVFEAPVHPLGPGLALDAAIDAARAKVPTTKYSP